MHNRFVLLFAVVLVGSTVATAQVTVTDTHEGGKPVPKPAPFNLKSARQAPLNNQAIIQMVTSGQQQASIIAVLRSRRGSFDLSPKGCASLRAANVGQGILNAMGNGSRTQCNSSMPTPGSVQNHQKLSGGTLLGNRNSTLIGGAGGHGAATSAPSNGGDPVSLNPQPLPPRTSKSAAASSARTTKIKSVPGTSGTVGTSPTPQH